MYRKNVASQGFGFTMVTIAGAADAAATVTVKRSIDGGGQASATGSVTNLGSGQYWFAMSQADTNGNNLSFLMTATGDVPVEKTLVTTAADPTDAVRFGITALPNALFGATGGLASLVERAGTAQSGSNLNAIKLDSGASSTTDAYRGMVLVLTGGTGSPAVRVILGYNGSSKQATVDNQFLTAPDNTTTFQILRTENAALNNKLQPSVTNPSTAIRTGTAQAGSTANTIVLDSGASPTNTIYEGCNIAITSGTGLGQPRTIIAYNGSTKVATVSPAWVTTPDNTSVFSITASTTPSQFSTQGVAVAATNVTNGTITLASDASTTTGIYIGSFITILSGTDSGDTAEITAYNGSTKIATIRGTWAITPDTTSAYAIIPTQSQAGVTSGVTDVNIITWLGATPNALQSGRVDSYLGAGAAGVITSTLAPNLDAAITSRMATFTLPTNFSSLAITGGGAVAAGTVSDKTGYSLSQSFPTNFASLAITGGGAVTAGTVSDKTGYSLTQSFPANFASLAITAGGAVTAGTVSDKTGYSLTQSFPSNFAALGITAGGHISNVDTLTTYTGDTPQTGDSFNRIGATGSGLTSLAPSSTALSTANWTGARAGYLDNLNVGGFVASQADASVIDADVLTRAAPGDQMTLAANAITATAIQDGAITDAKITVPAVTTVATGVLSMLVQLWRYIFKKTVYDPGAQTIKTYADDGTTVVTTQTATVASGVETHGPAS